MQTKHYFWFIPRPRPLFHFFILPTRFFNDVVKKYGWNPRVNWTKLSNVLESTIVGRNDLVRKTIHVSYMRFELRSFTSTAITIHVERLVNVLDRRWAVGLSAFIYSGLLSASLPNCTHECKSDRLRKNYHRYRLYTSKARLAWAWAASGITQLVKYEARKL